MKNVDVIINVYGKPWQTLCTLKSLMKNSGQHIDKIFLIKENEQPYNENIDWIFEYFNNLIVHTPKNYRFIIQSLDYNNESDRLSVRYQYGIEKSDKKFVFITHNDVLYTGDVIGKMLELIGESIAIGQIGQCWNCPANSHGVCNGEIFNEWNPNYEDVLKFSFPHVRTELNMINKTNPKPLPECRINEWACLLNREIIIKESKPNGNHSLFGEYGLDLGVKWFREMYLLGYNFIDYRKNYLHGYWASNAGHPTQKDLQLYKNSELNAANYYNKNFK
jgi:hypothetical protein